MLNFMPQNASESAGIQQKNSPALAGSEIRRAVEDALQTTQFIDIHTHLFKPSLGALGLWGIDELVTYHYLEAELFRSSKTTPDQYWKLTKQGKADLIWRTLFVENLPVSESTRGVVAVLKAFDLPTSSTDLSEARRFFADQKVETHIQNVFKLAGISEAVMTNDPLDPEEAPLWEQGTADSKLFHPVLRLDRILNKWADHWQVLQSKGYKVERDLSGNSVAEIKRFVDRWCELMKPVYMAVSLPDTFQYPEESTRARLLREVILPACRHFNIPLSLMIGVRYQVNPAIKLAGDAVGKADLRTVEHLCRTSPIIVS